MNNCFNPPHLAGTPITFYLNAVTFDTCLSVNPDSFFFHRLEQKRLDSVFLFLFILSPDKTLFIHIQLCCVYHWKGYRCLILSGLSRSAAPCVFHSVSTSLSQSEFVSLGSHHIKMWFLRYSTLFSLKHNWIDLCWQFAFCNQLPMYGRSKS